MEMIESTIVIVEKIVNNAPVKLFNVPTYEFLLKKRIISLSDEWEAIDEPQAAFDVMPKFHTSIKFENGIQLVSEFDRLAIRQDAKKSLDFKQIAAIGAKIVEKVKDFEANGTGINFTATKECDNPEQVIAEKFLRPIPALSQNDIKGGAISFAYSLNDVLATIKIEPGKTALDKEQHNVIMLSANYHFAPPYIKKIQEFLGKIGDYKDDFLTQSNKLFGDS